MLARSYQRLNFRIISTTLKVSELSTILPPERRKMPNHVTSILLPIGGTSMNSPRWVARVVQRAATISPSAMMSRATLTPIA
jgi:hypothetical protein